MKLDIIIVNYNVRYFLEQTLLSVYKSKVNFDFQVHVVDNASGDGSVEMVRERFPDVNLIANKDNVGFSAANNQILEIFESPYALLLNPDTILSEETLQVCVDKMDVDEKIGGLGVRMIDGGGQFLPESKRGLPTPFVAFCKAFGLSRIFPKSKVFNQYHLGHIDEHEESEIDVLSGAFMLLRKTALDQVGLLDDTFFMYGEDIDLSYRIQKAGFKNLYFPSTSIVHFKGESTKRGSINYVRVFYKAMIIFAKKHFVGSGAFLLLFLYQVAVWLRAGMTMFNSIIKWVVPVLIDIGVILVGLRVMTNLWARYYFDDPDYFSSVPFEYHHILYTAFWIFSLYIGGSYDRYFVIGRLRKSLLLGTLILFVVFSLLPSEWRPSRAVLILGSVWTIVILSLIRLIWGHVKGIYREKIRLAIIGDSSEIERSKKLMEDSRFTFQDAIHVSPLSEEVDNDFFQGRIDDLKDIVEAYHIDELVFCAKNVPHVEIIQWMTVFSDKKVVRIIPEAGASMLASRFKNRKGELYAVDARLNIAQPERKRQKRFLDVLVGLSSWALSPFLLFLSTGRTMISESMAVVFGKKTWIGYGSSDQAYFQLPQLKKAVWDIAEGVDEQEVKLKMNYLYARDYRVWTDINQIWSRIF